MAVDVIRAVDHEIATGVYPDMTEHGWERDDWPALFETVIAADILVLLSPIWLGEKSSVCTQVIERLYGNSHLYSLQHLGYTIPPQADSGWLGEAGQGPSCLDPASGGPENDFTNRNTTFLTWNLLHLARMLKDAGGIPAHGNQRSAWEAGCTLRLRQPRLPLNAGGASLRRMTTHERAAGDVGSLFPVPDESELPERLQGLFAKARERLGFVPNVFRAYSFRPERLSAWFEHYRALHEPTENLDAADREMIAVVVSAANRCLYCLVAHGAALRDALGDPVLGERIAFDWRRAGLDDRRRAICAYAEKLTLHPQELGATDLQSLLEVGLTLEETWDVAEIAAMYNFTNRLAMATNMLPNEEYAAMARG